MEISGAFGGVDRLDEPRAAAHFYELALYGDEKLAGGTNGGRQHDSTSSKESRPGKPRAIPARITTATAVFRLGDVELVIRRK
jgi:hypothetical protein